jgi:hypothetical protein
MTFLAALLFLGIIASHGHALFAMASGPDSSGRMVRALTIRIGLSIVLFAALAAGTYFG